MHILVTCQTKRVTHIQDLINVDLMRGTSIGNKLFTKSTEVLEKKVASLARGRWR